MVLWLELRPADLPGTSIEIDYLLVTPVLPTGELQLPALQYWHQQRPGTHRLQVTPRAGFNGEIVRDRPMGSSLSNRKFPRIPKTNCDRSSLRQRWSSTWPIPAKRSGICVPFFPRGTRAFRIALRFSLVIPNGLRTSA